MGSGHRFGLSGSVADGAVPLTNGTDTLRLQTRVEISDQDGKVVLRFSKPTQNLVLEPQNAFPIAEAVARAAHTAKFGQTPPDGSYLAQQVRARLTEGLHARMVIRATRLISNLIERKHAPDYVARQVVDAILAEVDQ